jgi:Synergist-CTERM protein sorting domain-containing protein
MADGLVEPDGDRHNSYAWSMETMTNSEGDEYLYVGSNRDLIVMMFAQMGGVSEDALVAVTSGDIPGSSGDYRARIFRKKLYGRDNTWEQIYISPTMQPKAIAGANIMGNGLEMPLDMGYRGVVKYAAPGESAPSLYFGSMGYTTRLLKFGPDFEPGDTPEVVFETASGTTASLRPLVVHEDKLYVGVLTASDDPASADLQVLGSATPTGNDSWEPVADKNDFPGARLDPKAVGGGGIWDMISFNGYIYAFVGSYYTGNSDDGFMVFKGKYVGTDTEGANAYGWKWQPIVCTAAGAKYPNGVGNSKNMTASPFLYSVGGKDYVYVGTFADAPTAFTNLLSGGSLQTFLDVLTPCQVYRFGADDEWEMIIGNPDESNGVFAERKGNYGAGFFNPPTLTGVPLPTGISSVQDLSLNLYAWRMGVYNGKLYVTTFDPGVVLDYAENMVTDPVQKTAVRLFITAFKAYNDNPAGFDLYSTANGVDFTAVTRDGFGDKFNYGGRTIKPTENGLYVGTANPFYGGQVWKVSDVQQGGGSGGCSAAGAYPAVLLLLALPLLARKRR